MKVERDAEHIVKPKIRDYSCQLLVCTGPRCTQNGEGEALFNALQAKLRAAGLGVDACQGGPIVAVQPDGIWYYNVNEANIERIIQSHLKNGQVVEELVFHRNGGESAC